jgi:ferredoxin
VVVVGAGPVGLTAAHDLARRGHGVTVIDRNGRAGGKLRDMAEGELPAAVLDAEVALLAGMGIEFKCGIELGNQVTLDGLKRGFEAILITVGELAEGDGAKLGAPLSGAVLKADPSTCRLGASNVFAAGACVKPVKQVVRAMSEGRAAAECVHRFLLGRAPRRPEKPFSSIMGRLEPGELREFLGAASQEHKVAPCDRCAGINRGEAVREAARCLHCDCRSSGNCLLQHYAQVYGADASRFRSERRPFEQQLQPGGVIFEPGKCILCGICVKLTELAAEPLGLTFVGRGFDMRVAAPFGRPIQEGLRLVAEECVRHCPTGALAFAGKPAAVSPKAQEAQGDP